MSGDQRIDGNVEASADKTSTSSDCAYKEAESGQAGLLDRMKAQAVGLKAGLSSGITGEFGKPIFTEGGIQQAIERLRGPAKDSKGSVLLESMPWDSRGIKIPSKAEAPSAPVEGKLPWEGLGPKPAEQPSKSYDDPEYSEEKEGRANIKAETSGEFPWKERERPSTKSNPVVDDGGFVPKEAQTPGADGPAAAPVIDDGGFVPKEGQAPGADGPAATEPVEDGGWLPKGFDKIPFGTPSKDNGFSFKDLGIDFELPKPEYLVAENKIAKPSDSSKAPGDKTTDATAPGDVPNSGAADDKFRTKTDKDGFVTDFWVPGKDGKPPVHYKWNDNGAFREYDDAKKEFNPSSSPIDVAQPKANPKTGAVELDPAVGTRRRFYPDGRYEETDQNGKMQFESNGKGETRQHKYDAQGNATEIVVREKGKPVKEIYAPDKTNPEATGERKGYEYKSPTTGHVENMQKQDNGEWKLSVGDETHTFPADSKVDFDREGNRKVTDGQGVVRYEAKPDGTAILRDENGHVTETKSNDGAVTNFKRSETGEVEQVIVRNSQGQIVEHTSMENNQWDSPGLDDIQVDDRTGNYKIKFATGEEVVRKVNDGQELRDATDDYKLDAERVIEGINPKLSPEQEASMRSDLGEIAKLPPEQQHKIYESIQRINDAKNGPTKLTDQQRSELIVSMTHQIAHPDSIKQGDKDTCVAANVEKTMAMTHPDKYADMVSKLATEGSYTAADGTVVKAQRKADGSLADYSDGSKSRSSTSEVMQTAITQLGLPEGQEYRSYPPGHEPMPAGVDRSTDTGERIIVNGEEKKYIGIDRDAKVKMLEKLLPEDKFVSTPIANSSDLDQAWKANGATPPLNVTVRIDAPHTGMGDAREGGPKTHAVSITHIEYDANGKPTKVYYENTADGEDHSYPNGKGVAMDDFVKSMQSTEKDPKTGKEKPVPFVGIVRTKQ